jgi:hypothetical protein
MASSSSAAAAASLSHPPLPRAPRRPLLLVLVGLPGAGKSWLAARLAATRGLAVVDQDGHLSRAAVARQAAELLAAGRDCVVDRCNADRAQRAVWLGVAASAPQGASGGARCVAVFIDAPRAECVARAVARAAAAPLEGPGGPAGRSRGAAGCSGTGGGVGGGGAGFGGAGGGGAPHKLSAAVAPHIIADAARALQREPTQSSEGFEALLIARSSGEALELLEAALGPPPSPEEFAAAAAAAAASAEASAAAADAQTAAAAAVAAPLAGAKRGSPESRSHFRATASAPGAGAAPAAAAADTVAEAHAFVGAGERDAGGADGAGDSSTVRRSVLRLRPF